MQSDSAKPIWNHIGELDWSDKRSGYVAVKRLVPQTAALKRPHDDRKVYTTWSVTMQTKETNDQQSR